MFVVTPQMRCTFIQSCMSSSRPYFTSNQRTYWHVVKPEESTPKRVSTAFMGTLLTH